MPMIAVLFEVWPDPDHQDAYLELAASMRQEIESIDGFISVERFQSLTDESKLLSVSFFDNQEAITVWRNRLAHRHAQSKGKNQLFRHYRLRVAEVVRDYGPDRREQAPADSRKAFG